MESILIVPERPRDLLLMFLLSVLILSALLAFAFLPLVIKVFNLQTTSPNDTILRNIINFRFYLISKVTRPSYAGKVKEIFVYPLKSVSYISPQTWEIDQHGLKHDRQYLLAFWEPKSKSYQAYTQRNAPRLSLVKINYDLEENYFEFSYPTDESNSTYKSFKLPCRVSKEFIDQNLLSDDELNTDLWGIKFNSINIGKALSKEFCEAMNMNREGTTLLYSPNGKFVKTAHPKDLPQLRKVLFQDYYPIHILAQSLIDELNQRIKDQGNNEREVGPVQFRPNFVIEDNKIDLDSWFKITINGHKWSVVQKTPRCSIGNVRLETGDFDKTNIVSKTLRQYRRIDPGDKNGTFLGNYAIHYDSGYTVSVGDEFWLKQEKINTYLPLT